MRTLSEKVVVLTGAASGIGRALAVRLGREGAALALADVDERGLRETAALLPNERSVTTDVVDVARWDEVSAWADSVQDGHGGADVVINNAGVGCVATFEQTTLDDFDHVLGVNLWGPVHVLKAFLPQLRRASRAHVVNVGSVNSFVSFPTSVAYNVSKHGLAALTDTLAQELSGSSITVSAVFPGGVATNIARRALHNEDADHDAFTRRAMTTPERAADVIVRGILRGRRRIYVGLDSRLLAFLRRLVPGALLRGIAWGWRRMDPNAR